MEVKDQVKMRFHGVDILKTDFISYSHVKGAPELKTNINAKVFFPKENPNVFQIVMDVLIRADEFFSLSIVALGVFELNVELDKEPSIKKQFINSNAPAIMFPFVRSFINTFTANLGNVTGTIVLPTKTFKGELEVINISDETTFESDSDQKIDQAKQIIE